jgi:hypothetical protein
VVAEPITLIISMITCPMCETQQVEANECATCGKAFPSQFIEGEIEVLHIEGLDSSGKQAAGDIYILPIDELEQARFDPVQVTVAFAPEFESSQLPSAGNIAVEKMGDMQVDRVPDDGQRTVVPTNAPCRYCGTVPSGGSVCERCGMRLPIAVAAAVGGVASEATEKVRCRACGSPAWPKKNCGNCGVVN